MTDEEVERAKVRAEHAKRWLEDPLFKESLEMVNEALVRAVKGSKNEQEAFRAAIALQVYDGIVAMMKSHADTGKIVEFNQYKKRFGIF